MHRNGKRQPATTYTESPTASKHSTELTTAQSDDAKNKSKYDEDNSNIEQEMLRVVPKQGLDNMFSRLLRTQSMFWAEWMEIASPRNTCGEIPYCRFLHPIFPNLGKAQPPFYRAGRPRENVYWNGYVK